MSNVRTQYWCFTRNNYTELDIPLLFGLYTSGAATYLVVGREVGESGTRHLQGYIELSQRYRFNQIKSLLPGYHLERRRGSAQEASDYCEKDQDFYKVGDISRPQSGRRTDLGTVCDLIKGGASLKRVAEENPEVFVKYHKGLGVLKKLVQPKYQECPHAEKRYNLDHDWTKTQIFLGPTGCGKTTYALQLLPKALFCTHMDKLAEYNIEDYDGIIFDEASFVHLPREAQIHLCDQDQMRSLHVRYVCAEIPANTKKIFTSNKRLGDVVLEDPAILRRIQVHEF